MNRCKRCGSILIAHENVHAVDGELYCSRDCAVLSLTERFLQYDNTAQRYLDALSIAREYYEDCAEVVDSESILDEDLQPVCELVSEDNSSCEEAEPHD